jgi:hypothetical protein
MNHPPSADPTQWGWAPPAVENPGFNPADDRRIYAEGVAMLAEDERKQEQAAMQAAAEPDSMESHGLDPTSMSDCEVYSFFVMEMRIDVQDIADQVILEANDKAKLVADPDNAARVVAEAHRAADQYVARHYPPPPRSRFEPLPLRMPVRRARERAPRRRTVRREPGQARAPDRPRPAEDDDDPHDSARRAVARLELHPRRAA